MDGQAGPVSSAWIDKTAKQRYTYEVTREKELTDVIMVWLHETTGTAGCSTIWNHLGGPAAGAGQRLLEPDRPSPHDGGDWSQHTMQDVQTAVEEIGYRLISRSEAAEALTRQGYILSNDRCYGHALYTDEADGTVWWNARYNYQAFAVKAA